jgi:hypothetical protein
VRENDFSGPDTTKRADTKRADTKRADTMRPDTMRRGRRKFDDDETFLRAPGSSRASSKILTCLRPATAGPRGRAPCTALSRGPTGC